MDKPQIVKLADGQSVAGHMMPIEKAILFEDIPPREVLNAPDASHALTVRYRKDINKGDMVEYDGRRWRVLRSFDPHGPTTRPSLGNLGRNVAKGEASTQAGKWIICLVREK